MLKTADLCDATETISSRQVCKGGFKHFGGNKSFSGHIRTLKVFEDNSLLKKLIVEELKTPTVIVVDGGGSMNCALLGDNLASIALKNQISGFLIHGCIRDSVIMSTLAIGVVAIGTNPLKSENHNQGLMDCPLNFWGARWKSGDYVYVDEDGIILFDGPVHV